jgi:hypothetical protein
MKSYIIIFILLMFSCMICCDLLEVDIQGNYDYTSIQAAIEEAEDGDEILVHPGTYYENVDFIGKQLGLYSFFTTTGVRDYIDDTIIDGNGTGSCIRCVNSGTESSEVNGFTLKNGSGSYYITYPRFMGGGIYVFESNLNVNSCIIKENTAEVGGGISISNNSDVSLSDVIIRNNYANHYGGGIRFNNGLCVIEFDSINRCSIYNNYAPKGADLYCQFEGGNQTVYLDTVTVENYWGYHIFQYNEIPPGFTTTGLTIDHQNTWLDPVDADLYVSPEGDDTNSGLSWEEPLQSITWAIQKIAVNPIDPRTIHLSEGVFSASSTGEIMPFQCKDCTTIQGVSEETTVIDAEMESPFLRLSYGEYSFGLENLRFINSYSEPFSSFIYSKAINTYSSYNGAFNLSNLVFESNDSYSRILTLNCCDNVNIENVSFKNNGFINTPSNFRLMLWNDYVQHSAYLNNIVSINNNTGKIVIEGRPDIRPDAYVSNLVYANNYNYCDGSTGYENYYSLLGLGGGVNCYLINSTLANNTADMTVPTSSAIQVSNFCNLEVINSIIYNNETDYSINSINDFAGYEVNVHHSLIENGYNGINSILPFTYDYETNLDCDPIFAGDEEYPFALHEYSPCIDAGTTQMPEGFTLPETDAAGNPRIMGSGIDMGAYEYNPFGSPISEDEVASSALNYYPNPVRINEGRGAIVINYAGLTQVEDYQIGIYNIKGQRVRSFKIHPEKIGTKSKINKVVWDCCNTRGDKVAAGVYFLRLSRDGEYLEQGKLTVVK